LKNQKECISIENLQPTTVQFLAIIDFPPDISVYEQDELRAPTAVAVKLREYWSDRYTMGGSIHGDFDIFDEHGSVRVDI
jgi:hypothetical protein